MAFFADLAPCTYFSRTDGALVAVGWLEGGHGFTRGEAAAEFVDALGRLLAHAWQPGLYLGTHTCTLCPPAPRRVDARGRRTPLPGDPPDGLRNLFVPGEGGLFVAPELVLRYVKAHGYAPPPAFVRAVMGCPAMNSRAYIEAVRGHGLTQIMGRPLAQWTHLAEIDADLERLVLRRASAARVVTRALSGDPADLCEALSSVHDLAHGEWERLKGSIIAAIEAEVPSNGCTTGG